LKYFITIIILTATFYYSCSNDSVQDPNAITEDYTSILNTDKFGNILGGDTTDWCKDTCSNALQPCDAFSPAYPNPVNDTLFFRFSVSSNLSNLKLYFLNSSSDTLFLANGVYDAGHYVLFTTASILGYSNVYKRAYLKINDFSCYGDIKFN